MEHKGLFNMQHSPTKPRGFTLVEVLVISPIVIILVGTFIGFLVSLTGESLVNRGKNIAAFDTQSVLKEIEDSVTVATSYLASSGTLPTPQGRDNATGQAFSNTTSGQPDTLIITSPATTASPDTASRALIYTGSAPCNSSNPIYTYLTIYFVASDYETTDPNDQALFRRTVLPTGTTCATPWQRGSCDPSRLSSYPSICRRADDKMIGNVTTFDMQYFIGSSTTPEAEGSAATASEVSVNLVLTRQIAGETVISNTTSRFASSNITAN